jgi:hypothetical protein
MSMNRSQSLILSGMLLFIFSPLAQAEMNLPFRDSGTTTDFQFFSPAEYEQYSGDPIPANTGWFATWDRMLLNISRPEGDGTLAGGFAPADTDRGWGNRWDFGYMSEEDHGWLFTLWHVTGPGQLLRFQNHGAQGIESDPYLVSTNMARLGSFEANKTWRLTPFHKHAVLEPFIGFRFLQFEDNWIRESVGLDAIAGDDIFTDRRGSIKNTMMGAQGGFRFHCRRNAWVLSTEARAFFMQNWQIMKENTETQVVNTDPTTSVVTTIIGQGSSSADNSEFVPGGDLRVEAAYHVTRNIYLRVGLQVLVMGKGIGRTTNYDQSLAMVGTSFGLGFNR